MSLTVGELTAVLSVDDQAVDPALRRAEQALRQAGQQMGDDAERAGQQTGEQLGEGIVRGADGRLRNARGHFVRAGRQAGDAVGDGLADGTEQGADEAVEVAGGKLEKLKLAGAAAGAAAGAVLMAAMTEAMDQSRIAGRLGAQLGATPAEAQRYGKIAGSLYSKAITEDFQSAADAISVTMRSGLLPPDATNAQIESIATKVNDLASTFELDLGQAANAVGQILKTGLAKDGGEALDVLTRGLQVMGPRADDIADTFNEYSTIFRQLGISAEDATGIMSQGLKAGARDTDVVADSLKELVLITQGGGEEVDAAFAKIGLSGKEMQKAFTEGGPEAEAALDKIFDGLRKVKDPAERSALAVALFGTKSEDMQKALFEIDPSKAVEELGKVGGAADEMGDTLRDNAGTRLEAFKRGMQQNLVEFLGGPVLGSLGKVRSAAGRLWDQAGKGGKGGVDQIIGMASLIGDRVMEKVREIGPKIIEGLISGGEKAAAWVVANPTKLLKIGAISVAIIGAIVMLPTLVGAAISAAASLMMIGFVKRMGTALNENLPAWWQAFTGWISSKAGEVGGWFASIGVAIGAWFAGLWSTYIAGPVGRTGAAFITWVQGLPARAVAALAALGGVLASTATGAWTRFRTASVTKATEALTWIKGLPGRAKSALGNLGSVLVGAGRALIRGFIDGIKGMLGNVRSAASGVVSAARDFFPFSPAKRGPFSGRGYTTYSGQALVGDFARAIADGAPGVRTALNGLSGMAATQLAGLPGMDASLSGLVSTPPPSQVVMAGAGGVPGGSRGVDRLVRVDLGGELGDALTGVLRRKIGAGAGGDVQLYLGKRR